MFFGAKFSNFNIFYSCLFLEKKRGKKQAYANIYNIRCGHTECVKDEQKILKYCVMKKNNVYAKQLYISTHFTS